jgi:hypothetical protein
MYINDFQAGLLVTHVGFVYKSSRILLHCSSARWTASFITCFVLLFSLAVIFLVSHPDLLTIKRFLEDSLKEALSYRYGKTKYDL